jgi:hypothetical protein
VTNHILPHTGGLVNKKFRFSMFFYKM